MWWYYYLRYILSKRPVASVSEVKYSYTVSSASFKPAETKKACEEFNALGESIVFKYVARPEDAEIVVRLGAYEGTPFGSNSLAYTIVCDGGREKLGVCSDIFFNPLVNWDEYDYKTVFWHEALHGVGVEHHNDPRGLMFPSYTGAKTKLHLSDKHAIKNVLR